MQQDLTQGSITRHLLSMAAFIGVGLVFQTLYFLVDLFFVSRLGSAAIAGVSAAGAVFFLVMGLTQVISVGGMSLIAQAIGAKDNANADRFSNQALSLALALMAATFVCIYAFGGAAVDAVAADEATAQAARAYLFAFAPGLAFMFPSAALGAGLRAAGVVGAPMAVQTTSVVLNVILAPILIAGWLTGAPLGVAGAGLASTLAAAVSLLALLFMFPRVQTLMRFRKHDLAPRWDAWGRIVAIGAPAAGEFVIMFMISAVVYWTIKDFGPHAQAGFGVGGRIMQSMFLPVMAVAFAAAPVAGQNFGARNGARVKETFRQTALISSVLMLAMSGFAHWRPELLFAPFTDDPAALAVAEDYLKILSWNFVANGLVFTCSSMFQGMGDTRPALLASASRLVTFVAPVLWLAQQPFLTLHLVWLMSIASMLVQLGLSLWFLRRQFRSKLDGLMPRANAAAA